MATTKKPTPRPDEEPSQVGPPREGADQRVTREERERAESEPASHNRPEPSKAPGLDGDVYGR